MLSGPVTPDAVLPGWDPAQQLFTETRCEFVICVQSTVNMVDFPVYDIEHCGLFCVYKRGNAPSAFQPPHLPVLDGVSPSWQRTLADSEAKARKRIAAL